MKKKLNIENLVLLNIMKIVIIRFIFSNILYYVNNLNIILFFNIYL